MKCAVAVLLVVLLVLSTMAVAEGASLKLTSSVNATSASSSIKLLWQNKIPNGQTANNAPYYHGGHVFSNGGSEVAVFSASTGSLAHKFSSTGSFGSSSIAYHKDKIYFSGGDTFYCRKAASDGALVWSLNGSDHSAIEASPLVVAEHNAVYFADDYGYMYSVDADDGTVKWKTLTAPAGTGGGLNGQRPVYSKKHSLIIAGFSTGPVIAFDAATGKMKWNVNLGDDFAWYTSATGVLSSSEDAIYFSTESSDDDGDLGSLFSLHTTSGKVNWRQQLGDVISMSPVEHSGVLYVGTSDLYGNKSTCFAYTAKSGKQVWKFPCKPVVTDRGFGGGFAQLYGDDTVLFAIDYGVIAVSIGSADEAKTLYSWQGASSSVFGFNAPTSDGKLFVADDKANVYALQLP